MQPSLEAVAFVPLLAVAYVALRPRGPRAAAAVAGLALIFAAFVTPLQQWATHTFLWAHLLQNVVLAEWAPALLVLAVPPGRLRRLDAMPMIPALAAWLATYFAWHLPWVYDYALRQPHTILHVEHTMYLAAGIAMWWPVVRGAHNAGAKALYLFAAFVLASPIGLVLALIPKPIYDFYAHAQRTWGPSALGDQQLAGVTMALEQAAVFFAVFAFYLARFLREEQRDPEVFSRRAA